MLRWDKRRLWEAALTATASPAAASRCSNYIPLSCVFECCVRVMHSNSLSLFSLSLFVTVCFCCAFCGLCVLRRLVAVYLCTCKSRPTLDLDFISARKVGLPPCSLCLLYSIWASYFHGPA